MMHVRIATDTIRDWRASADEKEAEAARLRQAANTYEAELRKKHPLVCGMDGLTGDEHDGESDTDAHGPWVRSVEERQDAKPDDT